MIKQIPTLVSLVLVVSMLAACGASSPIAPENKPDKNTAIEKAPAVPAKKQSLADQVFALIEAKGDWHKILDLYKQLIATEEKDSPARKKALQYLMDLSLFNIQKYGKPQEGLDIAVELDKLIPNDFYIQNRFIYAYTAFANEAIKKKDYKAAVEWIYNKALKIRFEVEAMRTYLKTRYLMAKDDIAKGNLEEAKTFLKEVVEISGMDENKEVYAKENADAQALLNKIK